MDEDSGMDEVEHERIWPSALDGQRYVRDRLGVVWLIVHDGGMATTADYTGIFSVGLNVLRNARGPLYILDLSQSHMDTLAHIKPDGPCEHEPRVVHHGPYGEGMNRHLRSKTICRKCGETIGLG